MVVPAGPKVWFPNFVFTMVRSGKERAKNEVVFRVPRVLNKLDIRQYLEGLYGVQVLGIRTVNFLSKSVRQGQRHIPGRKNAIVMLREPLAYPPPTDPSLLKFPLANSNTYKRLH